MKRRGLKPWVLKESRYVLDNRPYSQTRQDRVELPNGDEITVVVHEHPDWVNGVVLTPDRQIVLVRQYRPGIRDFVLEIPGGMVDPGESPAAAIVREVAEETGYEAARPPMFLGSFWPNPALLTNRVSSFLLVDAVPAGPAHPDRTEDLERVVMDWEAYDAEVRTGRIGHLFSALAHYRARECLAAVEPDDGRIRG